MGLASLFPLTPGSLRSIFSPEVDPGRSVLSTAVRRVWRWSLVLTGAGLSPVSTTLGDVDQES